MSARENRSNERFRCHLSVSFQSADDFVVEYVENLSRGGVFVRAAYNLSLGQEVSLEIELPGFDRFQVAAKVAHLVSPEQAKVRGGAPGAGLQIVTAPDGFTHALGVYLERLGQRKKYTVLVYDDECLGLLEDAGFTAHPLPPIDDLQAVCNADGVTVVGIVVPGMLHATYQECAATFGVGRVVHVIDYLEEFDGLLVKLDEYL